MRWTQLLVVLVLGGCAVLRPAPLPVTQASMERVMVRPGPLRCLRAACRMDVVIGDARLTTETRTRVMSPQQAIGERRSLLSRAALSIVGEILVIAGASVGQDRVGLGTRVVRIQGDSSTRLRCDVGWVEEETRTRRDGNDEYTVRRMAEGMDCEAVREPDSLVTWHVHVGVSPTPQSLARTSDTLSRDPGAPRRLDLQLRIERADSASAANYKVMLDSVVTSISHAPMSVWGVLRPEGERIATIVWRYGVGSGALDLSPNVTADERRLLRLVMAALVAPLVSTQ